VIGLREIWITLARFIQCCLSFTVGYSVAAFRVKLGTNDLNCVDVPLNPTHSLQPIFPNSSRLDWSTKVNFGEL